jgi:hypothetical protein
MFKEKIDSPLRRPFSILGTQKPILAKNLSKEINATSKIFFDIFPSFTLLLDI